MLDRTDSSFDYMAVESASSQHHRMMRAGSTASVNSGSSDQPDGPTSPRHGTNDRTSKSRKQKPFNESKFSFRTTVGLRSFSNLFDQMYRSNRTYSNH